MRPATAILLALIVIILGCTKDISRAEPYRDYIHREMPLLRATLLDCETTSHLEDCALVDSGDPYTSENATPVPVGKSVSLDRVVYLDGIDAQYVIATGRLLNFPDERQTGFEYVWDYYGFLFDDKDYRRNGIRRAPWEDESVPQYRFVGTGGRQYSNGQTR